MPEMEKRGFSKEFSSVVTACSAMITPLIPPGIAMIVYGSIANVSIGNLFIAGIGPWLLLCVTMMLLVSIISQAKLQADPHRADESVGLHARAQREAALPLCADHYYRRYPARVFLHLPRQAPLRSFTRCCSA